MRWMIAVWFAVGVTGCGRDEEYVEALPNANQVRIAVPEEGSSRQALGESSAALVGTTSEFYQFTYGVSTGLNTTTVALIALLKGITTYPSTSSTLTSRTWGPHTPGGLEPLTFRLVVTKLATDHFSFSLEGRKKDSISDADFLPLLDGDVTKGAAVNTGRGSITVHFDNRRTLIPSACERGNVVFVFDNTQPTVTNDVTLDQFANDNTGVGCKQEPITDASYHFDQTAGAGNFVFSFKANIHKATESKPALEDVSIRSRWTSAGAGRADFEIAGGEVATDLAAASLGASVTASQCWSSSFATIYETSAPAQLNLIPTDGNESACAFTSAMLP